MSWVISNEIATSRILYQSLFIDLSQYSDVYNYQFLILNINLDETTGKIIKSSIKMQEISAILPYILIILCYKYEKERN